MTDDDPTKKDGRNSMRPRYVIYNSTITKLALRKVEPCKRYASPIDSDNEKIFSSRSSGLYEPSSDESSSEESSKENITPSTSLLFNKDISAPDLNEAYGSENPQPKKGKKRTRNENSWKQNVAKRLKNYRGSKDGTSLY